MVDYLYVWNKVTNFMHKYFDNHIISVIRVAVLHMTHKHDPKASDYVSYTAGP